MGKEKQNAKSANLNSKSQQQSLPEAPSLSSWTVNRCPRGKEAQLLNEELRQVREGMSGDRLIIDVFLPSAETNMVAPEKWWLEDYTIFLLNGLFSGATILVLGRVILWSSLISIDPHWSSYIYPPGNDHISPPKGTFEDYFQTSQGRIS